MTSISAMPGLFFALFSLDLLHDPLACSGCGVELRPVTFRDRREDDFVAGIDQGRRDRAPA